jgi:hypothetical protein
MNAIPTIAFGIRFRSRLEATWAHVLTSVCGREAWQYEPFDLEGYIPDFLVTWKGVRTLIEVKPDISDEVFQAAAALIDASSWDGAAKIATSGRFALTRYSWPDHPSEWLPSGPIDPRIWALAQNATQWRGAAR